MQLLRPSLLAGVLAAATLTAGAAATLRVEPSARPTDWTIYYGAQKLLVYASAPMKFKPYVKELYLITLYPEVKSTESLNQRAGQWAHAKP